MSGDGPPHELYKLLHIRFACIPGAHPAHHGFGFVPLVEKVPFLELRNCTARYLRKDPVRFDLTHNFDLWNLRELAFQKLRQTVGVPGVL